MAVSLICCLKVNNSSIPVFISLASKGHVSKLNSSESLII